MLYNLSNPAKKKATQLIFLYSFLGLIVLFGFLVIDPIQRQKTQNDKNRESIAQHIVESVETFYKLKGRYPWTDDLGSRQPAAPLSWTQANNSLIGICIDDKCFEQGELIATVATIEGVVNLNQETIYIGRGQGKSDPLYACFLPESKSFRRETGKLFRANMTPGQYPTPILESCSDRVTWEDIDICFRCISSQQVISP